MKKNLSKIGIIIFLIIIYIYTCNITMFPSDIILFEGQEIQINTILGINIKSKNNYETLLASTNLNQAIKEKTGKVDCSLNIFNSIPIKEVSVNIIPKTTVIPVGSTIGLKLYTQGILVVGMSEIQGTEPYQNSGIKEGDTILSINNKHINSTTELVEIINTSNGKDVNIEFLSEGEKKYTTISPSKDNKDEYKLGLWVRDAAAGVGTITYYEPKTKQFAALGHGIQDIDTGKLITISKGKIVTASIIDIKKGERGNPGEIKGNISIGQEIGEISKNTSFGIYGTLNNITKLDINKNNEIDVATREEIQTGKAKIICTLQDNIREEFEIEIQKIYKSNNHNNKSMQIKITDPKLIEKTGRNNSRNER